MKPVTDDGNDRDSLNPAQRATSAPRRTMLQLALAAAVGLGALSGCSTLNTLNSEVSTFGEWPTGRKPGSYAFERLPSQESKPDSQALLEDAARPALAAAGFLPVAAGAEPDVSVQVGARLSRYNASPWVDAWRWHGGFAMGARRGGWVGAQWSPFWHDDLYRVERDVALLIRDRASGKTLYEARASGSGSLSPSPAVLRAMYSAALKDFPAAGLNPRMVGIPLQE